MPSRVRTTEELREALKQKLNELKDEAKADAVTLHLYDAQRERLYFPVGVSLLQEARFVQGMPSMKRAAGKVVHSGTPTIAEDAEHHPDLTGPFTHAEKVKAAAGFPLLVADSGKVMGVLFANYRRAHRFEEDEIERIQGWASELAEFISQSLQDDQGRMLRDALRMETDFQLEEVRLLEIIDRLWNMLGDADIALWTQERGKRELRIKMHAGMDRDFVDRVSANPDTDSSNLVSSAFVDGKEVLIENPQTDPGAIFNVAGPVVWTRMLAVPVSSEHCRLGVLCVFRRERIGFTRRERDLVRAFANLIAVTIENQDRIIALNALHDVGVRLALATDPGEILQEVVRSVCQVIGADVATVHLYDPARQEFYDLERSAVFPPEAQVGMEKPRPHDSLSAQIIEQGRIYCEDVDTMADASVLSTFATEQGIKAYVGTPLISIDKPLGVLYVSFREKRRFSPEELSLIQILANYASTAIYRAGLLEQRAAVTEIARYITSELDRDALLQKILGRSLRLLDCGVGSIALLDKATGELKFQYAMGKKIGIRVPVDKGLMSAAAQSRQPMRVGDVTKDNRHVAHVAETRSELDVPLLVGDELVGVLNVESPRYNAFSEEDEKVAMALASQAAVALYNASLFEQRSALIDFGRTIASGIRLREDEVLRLIHDQASKLMDTSNMYIALYDEATDTLRFGLAFVDGRRVDVEREDGWRPRRAGKGRTEAVIRSKQPVFHATRGEAGEWYAQPGRKEYLGEVFPSWLGVPMMVGERILGMIAVYHPTRDYAYSSYDIEILQAMGDQAAVALDNARMFYDVNRRLERRVRELETVGEIANVIATELEPEACMERILDEMMRLFGAHYAAIQLVDETTDELVIHAQRGAEGIRLAPDLFRIKVGEGIAGVAAQEKRTIRVGNVDDVEYYLDFIQGTRSEMATPLIKHGKVIGVLNIEDQLENAFDQDDEELFKLLAEQVVIAVQNAALFEEKNQALRSLREEQRRNIAAGRLAAVNAVAAGFVHRMNNVAGTIPVRVMQIRERLDPNDPECSKIVRYLDAITEDVDGILRTAQAIMSSTPTAEPLELVDVGVLVSTAIQRIAVPPGIAIYDKCDKALPLVLVFSGQMVDTLENLIRNGVEAIEDSGSVTIVGRILVKEAEKWTAIEIEDTGRGIPPTDLPRIFDLFFSTKPGGMGFALWRARTLVESLGGRIEVSSEMGKGTTFTILLPAVEEQGQR